MTGLRILVVDDAAVLRATFAELATGLGHVVAGEAATVEDAARLASELAPDAIVVDGRIGVDLPQAVRRVREAAPDAAVYVAAALGERELVRAAIAAGAAGALLRPYVPTQIASALGEG